jgi:DNA polymerase-1
MVQVSDGEYDALVYLDYSQIELRLQAFYTILVGDPDLNLCRAYMPFRCVDSQGNRYDYENPEHIKRWKEPWFLEEDPTKVWVPTDVHGATTCLAFDITPEDEEYDHLRGAGKRTNFAKNYGAGESRIRVMFPGLTDEQVKKIDQAYYTAFPGVKTYHEYCYRIAQVSAFAENLFGIRYYGVSGHNLINMLIQGSGAFFLKWKIRQLWEYAQEHQVKSRMQMNIHDEISWEKHREETDVFFIYKAIMEDWPDTWVPIVAEMEVTHSSWADKKKVRRREDL